MPTLNPSSFTISGLSNPAVNGSYTAFGTINGKYVYGDPETNGEIDWNQPHSQEVQQSTR